MGRDKVAVTVAGVSLLDRLLSAVPADVPVVIVGPAPASVGAARITREEPPGGGPVAAIAAGLAFVDDDIAVVCAVDLPFAGPVLADLAQQLDGVGVDVDAVIPVVDDRQQPLCAAYRTTALHRALAGVGEPAGRSMTALVAGMRWVPANVPVEHVGDVDTPHQLAIARRSATAMMGTIQEVRMHQWIEAIAAELGVPADVDVDTVLDIAKDAAHQVQRPAAPITTYLVGLAVASGMTVEEAAAKVHELTQSWPGESAADV